MQPYVAVSSRRGDADGARTELLTVQVKQKKKKQPSPLIQNTKCSDAYTSTRQTSNHHCLSRFLFHAFFLIHDEPHNQQQRAPKISRIFLYPPPKSWQCLGTQQQWLQPIGGIMTSSSASSGGMARCVYRCRNWTPSSSMRCFLSNVGEAKKVKTRCKTKHASAMSPRPRFLCNNLNNVLCLLFASFRSGRTICEPSLCVCFSFS